MDEGNTKNWTAVEALRYALFDWKGERMEALAADGATDAEILVELSDIWGLGGGNGGPDRPWCGYKGGTRPTFCFGATVEAGSIWHPSADLIRGPRLIALVRQAFSIGQPGQMELAL